MGKQKAAQFLRDAVQSGDTITYHVESVRIIGGNSIDDSYPEHTYSGIFDGSVNIGPAMAEALTGMTFNNATSTLKIESDGNVVISPSDGRTLTVLLGDLLGLPAHEHFNFEIK